MARSGMLSRLGNVARPGLGLTRPKWGEANRANVELHKYHVFRDLRAEENWYAR